MENQNTGQNQENTEKEQNENQIIRVNAYFLLSEDGLNEITQSLIILKDYKDSWKIIKKRDKFYIFFDNNRKYLKLWLDSKRNLLFYIGEFTGGLFFDSVEIQEDNTSCLIYTNNGIYCDNKAIEFRNMGLIDTVRQVDYKLVNPLIWLLCKVLY